MSGRRLFALASITILFLAGAGFLWARFFAGGPVGPIPGGALRGSPVVDPVVDWGFASSHHNVDVEHRGGALPWSRSVWFMVYEGRIHLILPSLFGRGLQDRLLEEPQLRIRLDGNLYDQAAVPVDTVAAFSAMLPPLISRLFAIEVDGELRPIRDRGPVETWIWRLEDP